MARGWVLLLALAASLALQLLHVPQSLAIGLLVQLRLLVATEIAATILGDLLLLCLLIRSVLVGVAIDTVDVLVARVVLDGSIVVMLATLVRASTAALLRVTGQVGPLAAHVGSHLLRVAVLMGRWVPSCSVGASQVGLVVGGSSGATAHAAVIVRAVMMVVLWHRWGHPALAHVHGTGHRRVVWLHRHAIHGMWPLPMIVLMGSSGTATHRQSLALRRRVLEPGAHSLAVLALAAARLRQLGLQCSFGGGMLSLLR